MFTEATSPATSLSDPISVLVVEDEEITRRALYHWLTVRKFQVSTAVNGASAIRLVVADRPQVILLDVRLAGGEDGLQLPQRLTEIGAATPFVVFTGSSGPQTGFAAHSLGAFAVIEKPALPDDIAAVLRAAAFSRPAVIRAAVPHAEHVRRAVAFIDRHYAIKRLSVSRIAVEIGVSADYLSRQFRQQQGCSILTYLHRTRHRHAKRFLAGSAMSIKEIADVCGYREAAELTRTFARLVGCSPTEYRVAQTHG
jgi:YesN/AraC family two-component response regulator